MRYGTMAYGAVASGGPLHRLELDGSMTTVLDGLTISNGIAFSPDGSTAGFVDSMTQQVRRYRMPADEGLWNGHDVIVKIDPALGTPDGLCLDVDGGICVALWAGSAVHLYNTEGALIDVVTRPVNQVAACTLGGSDGRTLFITSSTLGLDRDREPDAGAIFTARVSAAGEPTLMSRSGPPRWPREQSRLPWGGRQGACGGVVQVRDFLRRSPRISHSAR